MKIEIWLQQPSNRLEVFPFLRPLTLAAVADTLGSRKPEACRNLGFKNSDRLSLRQRAMAGNAAWQRWHSCQRRHIVFYNLQKPKDRFGFESHSLRHRKVPTWTSPTSSSCFSGLSSCSHWCCGSGIASGAAVLPPRCIPPQQMTPCCYFGKNEARSPFPETFHSFERA